MNVLERQPEQPALLHFGDGDYTVLRPGRHVVCAVSGAAVPLEALRYWSVERQRAYAGPREAASDMLAAASSRSLDV